MAGFFARAKQTMHQKRQNEPMVFYLYFILRALVLITLVRSAFLGHYEHMMLCVLTLVLLLVPSFLEHTLDIELPDLLCSSSRRRFWARSTPSTSAFRSGTPFCIPPGDSCARV